METPRLIEAPDSLAKASTPKPFSRSKTSNWVAKGGGLPAYIQHVGHALVKRGKSESEAIRMAIGVVKNWASGKGDVDANTRAAAQKAVAQWTALKAKAHVKEASARDRLSRVEEVLGLGAAERVAAGEGPESLVEAVRDSLAIVELCEADSASDATKAQGSPGKCASCGKKMPKNVKANRSSCPYCKKTVKAEDKD